MEDGNSKEGDGEIEPSLDEYSRFLQGNRVAFGIFLFFILRNNEWENFKIFPNLSPNFSPIFPAEKSKNARNFFKISVQVVLS